MKLIPKIYRDNNSSAEIKIFNLLKNVDLGSGWVAFHSLNISEHQYKQWAELDFVIVGPRGIINLEIKGGGIKFQDGMWFYTDRYGEKHKNSEGPFNQAKTGRYALQNKINKQLTNSNKNLCFGWGVVFPDTSFNQESPEWPKEVICDERFSINSDGFKKYLNRLFDYWESKGKFQKLSVEDKSLNEIVDFIRPNVDCTPSLSNRIGEINKEIISHTEEQYKFIDSLETADQILCSGGAGTGKTFLAIETARREIFIGNRVILVAMHEIFTAFLKAQLIEYLGGQEEKNILTVCSFSELRNLLPTFIKDPFDVLIVDEGQDLMTIENLDIFGQILKNDLDKGRWRFFMDENKQANVVGTFEKIALDHLKSLKPARPILKRNCRNTRQIVSQAEKYTGASIGKTLAKNDGIKVKYSLTIDREDEKNKLIEYIEKCCFEDKISLSDMVILSPLKYSDSVVSTLSDKWKKRIRPISSINAMVQEEDILLFSPIDVFKGLERSLVMLVDTDSINGTDHSLSLLYIAMTRAQVGLWIATNKRFEKQLFSFLDLNKSNV